MYTSGSIINFDNFNDTEEIKKRALSNAVDGGPNSGFEIEGSDYFKDDQFANEFPEMKDEAALIISSEAYVNRLIDFDARMRQAKGMSRGMALELKELVPDMQSFNPMHYTQDLSGIKYEVSLEAISAKIWALIAAAVAVALAIIWKFISWLSGGSSSGGGGGGGGSSTAEAASGLREAEKNVKAQAKAAEKIANIASKLTGETVTVSVPAVLSHSDVTHSHIPPDVKKDIIALTKDSAGKINPDEKTEVEIEVEIMAGLDEIVKDNNNTVLRIATDSYVHLLFTNNHEAIDLVADTFNVFGEVADDVMKKIKTMLAMVNSAGVDSSNHGAFHQIELPEPTRIPNRTGSDYDTKLHYWAGNLSSQLRKHTETELPELFGDVLLKYYEGYSRLADNSWENLERLFPVLEEGESVLKKLQEYSDGYYKSVKGGAGPEGSEMNAITLRTMTSVVSSELNSLMLVYSTLSKIYSDISLAGYDLLVAFAKHINRIITFHHKYGQPTPEGLDDILADVEKQMSIWRENPVHRRFLNDNVWKRSQRGK